MEMPGGSRGQERKCLQGPWQEGSVGRATENETEVVRIGQMEAGVHRPSLEAADLLS